MNDQSDIIKADPALRRKAALVVAAVIIIGVPCAYVAQSYFSSLSAELKENPTPERMAELVSQVRIILWVICCASWLPVPFLFRHGVAILGADQWPLPGARVTKDTKVIRGPKVKQSAFLLFGIGILVTCLLVYLSYNIYGLSNELDVDAPGKGVDHAGKTDALRGPETTSRSGTIN